MDRHWRACFIHAGAQYIVHLRNVFMKPAMGIDGFDASHALLMGKEPGREG